MPPVHRPENTKRKKEKEKKRKKEKKKKRAHISCIRLTVVHPSDDVVAKLAPRHVLERQTIRLVPLVKPPHLHQMAVLKTRQDAGLRQPTSSAQSVASQHGGTNTFIYNSNPRFDQARIHLCITPPLTDLPVGADRLLICSDLAHAATELLTVCTWYTLGTR